MYPCRLCMYIYIYQRCEDAKLGGEVANATQQQQKKKRTGVRATAF